MVDASAEQGQSPGRSARAIAASEAAIPYCQRHPDNETELRCGRCEVEICPRCMIHAPGGIRCPDCAQLRRPPMYELEMSHYLRAGGVALLGAVAIGVASALLLPPRPVGGLLLFAIALLAGMGAATLLARAFDAVTNPQARSRAAVAGGGRDRRGGAAAAADFRRAGSDHTGRQRHRLRRDRRDRRLEPPRVANGRC